VPGNAQHHLHHPFVEGFLAELLAGKVGMDGDQVDHVPAQDREVLFGHRLHEATALLIAAGLSEGGGDAS
jgi:hypothetical protein